MMLDTIKLALPQGSYQIWDHNRFTPSTSEMFSNDPWTAGRVLYSQQNPTARDRKVGNYVPRFTVVRRPLEHLGYANTLYAELSLPKLVYGNNFDELTTQDFELVKSVIKRKFYNWGIDVDLEQLSEVEVSLVHFGKNIVLTDYTTPYSYIKELTKIDIRKTADVNFTNYRNGGTSYKFHTNLFEFTSYDKNKDLERSKISEKRSLEKDDYCQLSLLDFIEASNLKNNPFEILRLEMRLNNRKTIRQTLNKYGLAESVTFEYLFDQELSRQMLLSFYDQIVKNYIPTVDLNSAAFIFQKLKEANPNIKEGKLLELATTQNAINELGVREFRNLISDKTWYRLKKDLKQLNQSKMFNYLEKLRNELSAFRPVHLVDYPQLMLNNVNESQFYAG